VTWLDRSRPVVLVFLLLASVTGSLWIRAYRDAPRGTVFVGTFYYVDDFYNYLSYVEQAERGAVLFRNKLESSDLPPALLNLEWLTVGWLSALLGGAPLLAYRLTGIAALAALVVLADRWLLRSGLAPPHRLPALLLVFTGGGLGGALLVTGLLPGERAFDVRTGAFPFVAALANPHFVVATALLLAALGEFASGRRGRAAAWGMALGLVRPYDAALLAAVEGLSVVTAEPPRAWLRGLCPVAAVLAVLAYDAWLFLAGPGFSVFSSPRYATLGPSAADLAIAIGPAVLLALTALRLPGDGAPRRHRARLALWALVALLLVLARPVSFSLQFIVGVGVPLLALGAVGLSRLRPPALWLAVPAMASGAVVASWLCSLPSPTRDVPAEHWAVAEALRASCQPGERVFSPPDIGLLVGGLTACWPYVSHPAANDYEARLADVRRFYAGDTPAERAGLLARASPDWVVLPPSVPEGWLGGAPYAFRLRVAGSRGGLEVLSRVGSPPPGRSP
jgi:hypothetical protein